MNNFSNFFDIVNATQSEVLLEPVLSLSIIRYIFAHWRSPKIRNSSLCVVLYGMKIKQQQVITSACCCFYFPVPIMFFHSVTMCLHENQHLSMLLCIKSDRGKEGTQIFETSMGILGDVCVIFVDQTVCKKKYPHAQLRCDHILIHVVTNHQTFLCTDV